MPRIKLSQRVVAKLHAPTGTGKAIAYWDTDLKGFAVLCSGRTASKSYIVQRDLWRDGHRMSSPRVTIAKVNELPAFAEAKARARQKLLELRDEQDVKPKQLTLMETLEAYLKVHSLRPRTQKIYRRAVELHLAPLHDKPLGAITPMEIDARHASIVGKVAANMTMRVFIVLFNWASSRDDTLGRNPCRLRRHEWHAVTPKRRPIPAEKLAAFYRALQTLPPMARDYFLLLLLTGMRRAECAALRWTEVDFAAGTIYLPGARVKNHRALDLPMSSFVRALLVARRALGDAEFVFPGRDGHIKSTDAWVKAVTDESGIDFSLHDLRRTFITIAESLDISLHLIKALVNHSLVGNDVTNRYLALTPERLRSPMQQVTDRITQLCGLQPPSGNVHAFTVAAS